MFNGITSDKKNYKTETKSLHNQCRKLNIQLTLLPILRAGIACYQLTHKRSSWQ